MLPILTEVHTGSFKGFREFPISIIMIVVFSPKKLDYGNFYESCVYQRNHATHITPNCATCIMVQLLMRLMNFSGNEILYFEEFIIASKAFNLKLRG